MNVCHICKSPEVTFTCPKCLRHGCNQHYTKDRGIQCSECRDEQLAQEAEAARLRQEDRDKATCYKCGKDASRTRLIKCSRCGKWECEGGCSNLSKGNSGHSYGGGYCSECHFFTS